MKKNLGIKRTVFKQNIVSFFLVSLLICSSFSIIIFNYGSVGASSISSGDDSSNDGLLDDIQHDISLHYTFDPPMYNEISVTDINYSRENSDSNLLDGDLNNDSSNRPTLTSTNYTFSHLEIPGTSTFSIPGAPVLPMKPIQILIPYGYTVADIEVKYDNNTMIIPHTIEPGAQPISFNDMDLSSFDSYPIDSDSPLSVAEQHQVINERYSSSVKLDKTIYNDFETFYPSRVVKFNEEDKSTVKESIVYDTVTLQKSHGYTILFLNLYPVRCRSVEKNYKDHTVKTELSYSTFMGVKISTKPLSKSDDKTFRGLESDKELIIGKIENPRSIDTYKTDDELLGENVNFYPYLIITNNDLKNYDDSYNFQRLLNYREAQGLPGKIVTIEEIENLVDGNSRPEKIRDFIFYAYKYWDTEYVLLGGDNNIIPAKNMYSDGMNIPSDMYYSCLDDGFDDLMAEVYIGRAPVENTEEVSNFVRKTLSYEISSVDEGDDYLTNALWSGEYLCGPQNTLDPYGVDTWGKDYKEETVGDDGLPVGDNGFNLETLYDKDISSYYSGGWDSFEMIDAINDGVGLISHVGHGSVDFDLKLPSSYVNGLSNYNKNFFVYSQSCLSGRFTEDDCFAEDLVVSNEGGAFAAIMNTGNGYGVSGSTNGPSQYFDKSFWKNVFDEEKSPSLGIAHQLSKEDNINSVGLSKMRDVYYSSTLFGDPAVGLKGSPGENPVPYNNNLLLGVSSSSTNSNTLADSSNSGSSNGDSPNEYKISVTPEFYSYGANTLISVRFERTNGNSNWSSQIISPEGVEAHFVTFGDVTLHEFKASDYTDSYVGRWEFKCSDDFGGSKSVSFVVVDPEDENTTGIDVDGDGLVVGSYDIFVDPEYTSYGANTTIYVKFDKTDVDDDGIPFSEDNCPITYNPDQADSEGGGEGDGIGDACDCHPNGYTCNAGGCGVDYFSTDSDGADNYYGPTWSYQVIDPYGVVKYEGNLSGYLISKSFSFIPSHVAGEYPGLSYMWNNTVPDAVGTWELRCFDDQNILGSRSVFLEVVYPEDEDNTTTDVDNDGQIGGWHWEDDLPDDPDDEEDRINYPPDKPQIVAPVDGLGGYDPTLVECKPLPGTPEYAEYVPGTPVIPGASGSSCGPLMGVTVYVYDLNGDMMDVYFYNKDNNSLIGSKLGVASGRTVTVEWPGLDYGETYSWYAVADDSNYQPPNRYGTVFTAVSDVASFSTIANASDPVSHWWNNSWNLRKPVFLSLGNHIHDKYTVGTSGNINFDPETGEYQPKFSNCNYYGEKTYLNFEVTIDKLPGMRPDFQDIRFVFYDDDETEAHYWIESYNDTCAKVRIKLVDCYVPMYGPRACLWMYYGNDDAENVSSYEWFYTGLEREWTRTGFSQFSGSASQVEVDSEHRVVAAGSDSICKLDSDGELIWENKVDYGTPMDIVIGSDGGVIALGSKGIVKLSSEGQIIWTDNCYDYTSIALDSQDNIVVAGHRQHEGLINAYAANGIKINSEDHLFADVGEVFDIQVDPDDNIIVSGSDIELQTGIGGDWEKSGLLLKLRDFKGAGLRTYTQDIGAFYNDSFHTMNLNSYVDWYNMTGYDISDIYGMASNIYNIGNNSDFSNCSSVQDVIDVILSHPITLRYTINVENKGRLPLENINIPLNFLSYNGEDVFDNISDIHASSIYIENQLYFTETGWSDYNEFDALFIEMMYDIINNNKALFYNFNITSSDCDDENSPSYYWVNQIERFSSQYDFDFSEFFENMVDSVFWNNFGYIDTNIIMKMYGGGFHEIDPPNFNIHLDILDVNHVARISFFVTLNNAVVKEIINDIYDNTLNIDGSPFSFNEIGMNIPSTPLLTYYVDEDGNDSIGLKLFDYTVTADSKKGSLSVSDYGDVIVLEDVGDLDIINSINLPDKEPVIYNLPDNPGGIKGFVMLPPENIGWGPYWEEYIDTGFSQIWRREDIEIGGQHTSVIQDFVIYDNGVNYDIIANYNDYYDSGVDRNGGIVTFTNSGTIKSYKAENRRPVALIDQAFDTRGSVYWDGNGYDRDGEVRPTDYFEMVNLSAHSSYDPDGQIVEYRWFKGYETWVGGFDWSGLPVMALDSEKMFATGKEISFNPFLGNPEGWALPDFIRLEVVDNNGEVDDVANLRISYPADWVSNYKDAGDAKVSIKYQVAQPLVPWDTDCWTQVRQWVSSYVDDDGIYHPGYWVCFLKDTKISMANGRLKNIQDIKLGDKVKSYNQSSGEWGEGTVTELFHHSPDEMGDYYLLINDDLRVTPNHPILVDNEWIDAGDLCIGDVYGGNIITSIERIYEHVKTYNFEVEPYHTYGIIWGNSNIPSVAHNQKDISRSIINGDINGGDCDCEPMDLINPNHNAFISVRKYRDDSSSQISNYMNLTPTTEEFKAGVSETVEFIGVLNIEDPPLFNSISDVMESVLVIQRRDGNARFSSDDIYTYKNVTLKNGFVEMPMPLSQVSSGRYIARFMIDFLNKGLYSVGLKFRVKQNSSLDIGTGLRGSGASDSNIFYLIGNSGIVDVKTVNVFGPGANYPIADAGTQRYYSINQEFNSNPASFNVPHLYRTVLGVNLPFDGSKSCDLDDYLVSPVIWDWGDGTVSYYDTAGVDYNILNNDELQKNDINPPVSGAYWDPLRLLGPNHEYPKEGKYIANLTVFDNYGLSDSSQANVVVDGWTGGGWSSPPGEHGYTGHHLELASDGSLYIITNEKIAELDKDYNVNNALTDQLFTDNIMRYKPGWICDIPGTDYFGIATDQDGPFKTAYAVGSRTNAGEWMPLGYGSGAYIAKYHYYDVEDNVQMRRNGAHENMTLGPAYTINPIIDFNTDFIDLGDQTTDQIIMGSFEIWNSGNGTLDYTLNESCYWLELDTISGSSTGEHDIINFVVDTSNLQLGTQTCEVTINCDYVPKTITFSLNILIPWLRVNPNGHLFDDVPAGSQVSTSFDIWNWWTGTLEYSIFEDCDWLGVDTISGNCTTEHDTITVNVDTTGLTPGFYSYDIQINSNAANSGKDFSVTVQVIETGLSFNPSGFDFGDKLLGDTDSTSFEIWYSDNEDETLEYSLSESCSWVEVSPISGNSTGEHDTITVDINTSSLSSGVHACDITINSNLGNNVFTVSVNVIDTSSDPILSVNPDNFDIGTLESNQTSSTTFDISNIGAGNLEYIISESCSWLEIGTIVGNCTDESDTITVNVNTTGLTPGFYTYDIQINSNGGDHVFSIQMTVTSGETDLPVLSINPASFNFGKTSVNTTASTSFIIKNAGGKTLEYSLSENCDWLEIDTLSGSSTGESDSITISVNTTGLAPEIYTYDIQIDSNGGNAIFSISIDIVETEKTIVITSPENGFVYLFGGKFMKLKMFNFALVIGGVEIEYETNGFEPSHVRLLTDDDVLNSSVSDNSRFVSNSKSFGKSVFKVVAYDESDNVVCSDEIEVFNVNLRGQ